MVIDGHSMAYRAYHALKDQMHRGDGKATGAVYGFMSMLANLVRDHQPEYLAVAFDPPGPTFRDEKVSTYKATRAATPPDFIEQLEWLRELLAACQITDLEIAGVEADDVLATCAARATENGIRTMVVSGDRDTFQLVEDPHVCVLYPSGRGMSDPVLMDEAEVMEKAGVPPSKYVDYAAMRGDTSDNLPGVPGVGEKTAAKLIDSYGDIEGILANAEEQSAKLRAALESNAEVMYLNREMMTLLKDVELPEDIKQFGLKTPDHVEVRRQFLALEFGHNLAQRLAAALGMPEEEFSKQQMSTGEPLEPDIAVCATSGEAAELLGSLAEAETEGTGGDAETERTGGDGAGGDSTGGYSTAHLCVSMNQGGVALVLSKEAGKVAWIPADVAHDGEVKPLFGKVFSKRSIASHRAKPWMKAASQRGVKVERLGMDTEIAGYLLGLEGASLELERLLRKYTSKILTSSEQTNGQLSLEEAETTLSETEIAKQEATKEALAVAWLCEPLANALADQGMSELFAKVEVPLVPVLAKMETNGVGVDRSELERLNENLKSEVERLRGEIHKAAGDESTDFNPNSPKQLQKVLFEDLGLTPLKQTKRGPSTDAGTLQKLRGEHPIIELLLEYREVEKLRSTYGEGLLKEVEDDERIHAVFNQIGARTGRLSSESPNLHNIPVRTEQGRQFRRAFVAPEGSVLVVADYDQIELRCIAHLANDPGLIAAFTAGDDVHVAVASRVFETPAEEVTFEQRSRAKAVSYGLVYGMEAFGLAQRMDIPNEEAQEIMDNYFGAFHKVKGYMDDVVAETEERGYTETLYGRRRLFADLSRDMPAVRRNAAARQAMNAGIQGLAADIFKDALVKVDKEITARGLSGFIVLQVHDEIILEVPVAEREAAIDLVRETMAGAYELVVPLVVSVATGKTWADAKG